MTKSVSGDVTLGFFLTLLCVLLPVLGPLVMLILQFSLRPTRPAFTRGIDYGLLLVVLMIMTIALCFYGISHERV